MRRALRALAFAVALCAVAAVPVASAQSVMPMPEDPSDVLAEPGDAPTLPHVQRGGPLYRGRSQQSAVDLVRATAAEQVGVSIDQVAVVAVQDVEWPDVSLGCASQHPHMAFAQVVIPGFIVDVDVLGTPMTFHTDGGLRAIACEAPAQSDAFD